MKVNTKSIVFAAAITALATPMMAGAVVKTNQTEVVSIPVVYSGYDLSSIEGRAMVERKIQSNKEPTNSISVFEGAKIGLIMHEPVPAEPLSHEQSWTSDGWAHPQPLPS